MRANRNVKKGETIEEIGGYSSRKQIFMIPSSPLRNKLKHKLSFAKGESALFGSSIDFCRSCGRAIRHGNDECVQAQAENPSKPEISSGHAGEVMRKALESLQRRLPNFCNEIKAEYSSTVGINADNSHQEQWHYCSSFCKSRAIDLYGFCCSTMKFFDRIFHKQKRSLMREDENDVPDLEDVALLMAAIVYRKVFETDLSAVKVALYDLQEFCRDSLNSYPRDEVIDEKVMECWIILRSEISTILEDENEYVEFLNPRTFNAIYKSILEQGLHQISIMHPLGRYIQCNMLKLSDDELKSALEILDGALPGFTQKDSRYSYNTEVPEKVLRWRSAARLVQAVNGNTSGDEEFSSMFDDKCEHITRMLRRTCFVFCPSVHLQHSCVPNCFVEGSSSEMGLAAVNVSLIALHDIRKGQKITISRIDDFSLNIQKRQKRLQKIFGANYICDCIRCRCERNWDKRWKFRIYHDQDKTHSRPTVQRDVSEEVIRFHCEDLKSVADLSMQNANYKVANDLYSIILKVQPSNGDVMHARCASFLERGLFEKAQAMWKEAYKICPDHSEIALQARKQIAYGQEWEEEATNHPIVDFTFKQKGDNIFSYETLIPSKAFVTKPDYPILTSNECVQAIQWAEAAALGRQEGWTTSRHYAVPTTDIPIHEIPPLLNWFNNTVLKQRLRPLLASQFGESEVGQDGSGIFIHDAFIVRYDASGGQNHLPLHRDQSTHSFTIALNSHLDYDGGGTYVAKLGRAIRVEKGGAFSFRGDELLHGGDPVVRGRRYIIVAFCYVFEKSVDKESRILRADREPIAKKKKFEGFFHKSSEQEETGSLNQKHFSFGFQF